jgi:flagellar biosynthetic protein FliR
MATLTFNLAQLQIFFMIFVRMAALLSSIPVLANKNIPAVFKVGLALSISLILFPLLKLSGMPHFDNAVTFGLGIAAEVILGFAIGLAVKAIFAGIQLAGKLAGYQMGLAIANVLDPASSVQVPLISQVYNIVAMLIFVVINAHHWLLQALIESFRLVPPFGFQMNSSFIDYLVHLTANIFVIAIKVGAPVIVVLLITSVALGLIARTVPQMNIFIVAIPLKIVVGLTFLVFSFTHLSAYLGQVFSQLANTILLLLNVMD